jgi:hypothetical protein
MATLWLKDEKPGEQPKKRFVDKQVVRKVAQAKDRIIEAKVSLHEEAKRQLKLATWTIAKLDQQIKDLSDERKWLFLTIAFLAAFLVAAGVLKLA